MRCLRPRIVAVFAFALGLAGTVSAQSTGPSAFSAAAASQPDAERLRPIIAHLGDADFAAREAAQKELGGATWRDLDFLRKASQSASDPEIKSRLLDAVVTVEEKIAVDPPPISVSFKNHTAAWASSALGTATHTKFTAMQLVTRDGGGPMVFDIDAHEQPFWEVFFALARQHPISLRSDVEGLALGVSNPGWQSPTIVGPLAVIPISITRTRVTSLQEPAGSQRKPETQLLDCTLAMDPRVRVSQYAAPRFAQVLDDIGNDLATPMPAEALQEANRGVGTAMSVFPAAVSLKVPEKSGTRIVSAKGSVHFVVFVGDDVVEVPEIDKKVGETVKVGTLSFRVARFEPLPGGLGAGGRYSVGLQSVRDAGVPLNLRTMINVTIVDSTGKELYNSSSHTILSVSATFDGANAIAPFKLRLSVPNKTKDLVIPFELKDLSLP